MNIINHYRDKIENILLKEFNLEKIDLKVSLKDYDELIDLSFFMMLSIEERIAISRSEREKNIQVKFNIFFLKLIIIMIVCITNNFFNLYFDYIIQKTIDEIPASHIICKIRKEHLE